MLLRWLPILFVLSACGMSDEEIRLQREQQYRHDMGMAQRQCLAFGFKANDNMFPLCVTTQYNNIIQARNAEFQQRMASWQAIRDAGQALQGPPTSTYKCTRDFGLGDSYTCESD